MAYLIDIILYFSNKTLEVFNMSKGLSLWFAASSIITLAVAAIAISHSGWIALLLTVLGIFNIGWGFVIKSKRRKSSLERLS